MLVALEFLLEGPVAVVADEHAEAVAIATAEAQTRPPQLRAHRAGAGRAHAEGPRPAVRGVGVDDPEQALPGITAAERHSGHEDHPASRVGDVGLQRASMGDVTIGVPTRLDDENFDWLVARSLEDTRAGGVLIIEDRSFWATSRALPNQGCDLLLAPDRVRC
jgi:hypothetical protein